MSKTREQFANSVVRRLQEAGFQAFWAGGCVRDLVLEIAPKDYDVATDARPEQVQRLFSRTLAVGASFGVIIVLGGRKEGQIEVATFRTDEGYSDGRRPDRVQFTSPAEDARRRDFTINGMFYDPVAQKLYDYVDGKQDLERGIIRAIGDPYQRFGEDKLRLLRAARFAARFEFQLDDATRRAIEQMVEQVQVVSPERIQQELRAMLEHPSKVEAIRLLDELGLGAILLPEVHAMHKVPQRKRVLPGKDLWEHTLLAVEMLERSWKAISEKLARKPIGHPPFTLVMACLLHDVGKPATLRQINNRLTFHNHEHEGKRSADQIARRLRLSNKERERIVWLVEYHMYLGAAKTMRLSKLKRIFVHPGIVELLALHWADALASTGDVATIEYCVDFLRQLPEGELNPPPLLTGHDLVRLGMEPSPRFKGLLEQVREAQLEGLIRSKKEAIEMVEEALKSESP